LEIAILKRPPNITDVLGVLALILGLAFQASWFLIATSQAKLLALSNLAGRMLSGILIVFLIATEEKNPSLLFLATTIGVALSGAISLFFNREPVRKLTLLLPKANLIKFSTPAFYGIVASALQNVMGQTLVGVFAGTVGAGVYAAVDRIARTISSGLKPLFMVMYPRMANLHSNSPDKAAMVMNWSFAVWAVFAATSLSVCYLFGDSILIAIYGKEMAGGGKLFVIIIGWLCFGILNNIVGIQGLLASGRDHEYSFGMWIGVISTLIFAKVFAAIYDDIKGVAFAVLIGEITVAIFFVFQFFKRKAGGVQC
jgi:PST family polysaccharide transporter